MAKPVKLEKYQILIAPDSKKVQGLQTGDIVRRQYFDGSNIIYSLMCVLAHGTTKRFSTEAQYDVDGKPVFKDDGTISTVNIEKMCLTLWGHYWKEMPLRQKNYLILYESPIF